MESQSNNKKNDACDWGFPDDESYSNQNAESNPEDSQKLRPFYRKYIEDYSFLNSATKNEQSFCTNPMKALKRWFDDCGEQFETKIEELEPRQFSCSIEIPLDGDLFEVHSEEIFEKKTDAIHDTCLKACRLLDHAGLLYEWMHDEDDNNHSEEKNKRKSNQIESLDNCEDDSDDLHDETVQTQSKRQKLQKSNVHTYDTLMAEWTKVNMEIVKGKARLVQIDMSVTGTQFTPNKETKDTDEEDEEDPLDAFMKTVNKKQEFTLSDKIEKTQLKVKIDSLEKEKIELQRLLEIAKPKFDSNKTTSKLSNRIETSSN